MQFTKKRVLSALGVITVLAITSVAIAYWTTSGSGSGTATAGSDSGVTVDGNPADGITPGGSVAVTSVIHNAHDQSQYVKSLTVSISVSNAYDATSNPTGCKAADFTYAANADDGATNPASNPHTTDVSTDIAANSTKSIEGDVYMANTNDNQDGCKNATVTLNYTANAS
jgi:hypothetical protein